MSPDIKIKDYYLKFINEAKDSIKETTKLKKDCVIIKEDIHNYISKHKTEIAAEYNINLDDFKIEWKNKQYNPAEKLNNKVVYILKTRTKYYNKSNILQLAKYCKILYTEHTYDKSIELANDRKNLSFKDYKYFVYRYYTAVHKATLEGFGYRYDGGIGDYMICHWIIKDDSKKHKRYLDYNKTNIRKKELLAKGLKLYDAKEEAWYRARNIPYDGVEYRVYKDGNDFYDFSFRHSSITKKSTLEYKKTEYVSVKYRGMTYQQIADCFCKTDEDIFNLQVDIKYKLNMLLYKDPTKYLRYVRTVDQIKYKYR